MSAGIRPMSRLNMGRRQVQIDCRAEGTGDRAMNVRIKSTSSITITSAIQQALNFQGWSTGALEKWSSAKRPSMGESLT